MNYKNQYLIKIFIYNPFSEFKLNSEQGLYIYILIKY